MMGSLVVGLLTLALAGVCGRQAWQGRLDRRQGSTVGLAVGAGLALAYALAFLRQPLGLGTGSAALGLLLLIGSLLLGLVAALVVTYTGYRERLAHLSLATTPEQRAQLRGSPAAHCCCSSSMCLPLVVLELAWVFGLLLIDRTGALASRAVFAIPASIAGTPFPVTWLLLPMLLGVLLMVAHAVVNEVRRI